MVFPTTQRPQNRYPIPPHRNVPSVGMRRNQMYRNAPLQRGTTSTGGISNFLGRILGSGGQMSNTVSQGGGLSQSLANIQQILNVVQSTAPIIQEYGPMVKNLPAMYRMMKAFKDLEKMDGGNETKDEDTSSDVSVSNEELIEESTEEKKEVLETEKKQEKSGESTPKLYI